jgi:hypothetical protein
MDELCPICIENPAEIITICNHTFCICCLSRITKCAICRSPLQRAKLCIEIKTYTRNHMVTTRLKLNGQDRFSEWEGIDIYNFLGVQPFFLGGLAYSN